MTITEEDIVKIADHCRELPETDWEISQPVAEVSRRGRRTLCERSGSVRTPDRRLVTARYRFLEGSDRA